MSILLDFNVLNQKGSPALYEDIFANRPAASFTGRIFIATDTGNLYRDTGTTWFQLATSGGASGIDDVLAIQQKFTANRDIDGNNWDFTLFNYKTFKLQNDIAGGETYLHLTNRVLTLGDFDNANNRTQFVIDDTFQTITTHNNGVTNGLHLSYSNSNFYFGYINSFNALSSFYFEFSSFSTNRLFSFYLNNNTEALYLDLTNEVYKFGRIYNGANNKELCLQIDYTLNEIATYYQDSANGFRINVIGTYEFGDIGNTASYLIINTSTDTLQTYFNNAQFGLLLDDQNKLSQLGDYNGNGNSTVIVSDDTNAIITLYSDNEIYLNDNGTGNMISASSSGSSGDHLVINVNGNQYKIALLNP